LFNGRFTVAGVSGLRPPRLWLARTASGGARGPDDAAGAGIGARSLSLAKWPEQTRTKAIRLAVRGYHVGLELATQSRLNSGRKRIHRRLLGGGRGHPAAGPSIQRRARAYGSPNRPATLPAKVLCHRGRRTPGLSSPAWTQLPDRTLWHRACHRATSSFRRSA